MALRVGLTFGAGVSLWVFLVGAWVVRATVLLLALRLTVVPWFTRLGVVVLLAGALLTAVFLVGATLGVVLLVGALLVVALLAGVFLATCLFNLAAFCPLAYRLLFILACWPKSYRPCISLAGPSAA